MVSLTTMRSPSYSPSLPLVSLRGCHWSLAFRVSASVSYRSLFFKKNRSLMHNLIKRLRIVSWSSRLSLFRTSTPVSPFMVLGSLLFLSRVPNWIPATRTAIQNKKICFQRFSENTGVDWLGGFNWGCISYRGVLVFALHTPEGTSGGVSPRE